MQIQDVQYNINLGYTQNQVHLFIKIKYVQYNMWQEMYT